MKETSSAIKSDISILGPNKIACHYGKTNTRHITEDVELCIVGGVESHY